jgi:hypothetical protein
MKLPAIPKSVSLFDLLAARAGVRAAVIRGHAKVWHLPVNGLVLPVGKQVDALGYLAGLLRDEVGTALWAEVHNGLVDARRQGNVAQAPVTVRLLNETTGSALLANAPEVSDVSACRYAVIAATAAYLSDVRGLSELSSSIIRVAAESGVKRLAIPTLGTGRGQFRGQDEVAVQWMVQGVWDALHELPAGAVREVTITTHLDAALAAMQKKAADLLCGRE